MDSPAVEVIGTMSNGSCVLRIENGLAYRIYKTSTPRIKAIFDGSRPAVENKTLVIVPENLIEDFSEALKVLCPPDNGFLIDAGELGLSPRAELISTGKSNINDIWVNDNF